MVAMSGATRFCEVLEKSFARADAPARRSSTVRWSTSAVTSTTWRTASPTLPVRLYPAYRELVRLAGREDSSEIDLFFPDLTPAAPAHPMPKSLEESELASFLQASRNRWQRGILAWLRRQPSGLEEMLRDAR